MRAPRELFAHRDMATPGYLSEAAPCRCKHPLEAHAKTADGRLACIAAVCLPRVGDYHLSSLCPCENFELDEDDE